MRTFYLWKMARKKTRTLAFKATKDLEERLVKASVRLNISKSMLFLTAVEAVLAAIERDGGLVMPVRFDVSRRPVGEVEVDVLPLPIHKGPALSEERIREIQSEVKAQAGKEGGVGGGDLTPDAPVRP